MTFTGKPNTTTSEPAVETPAVDWSTVNWEQLVEQLKSDIGFYVDKRDSGSAGKLITEIQHLVSPGFLDGDDHTHPIPTLEELQQPKPSKKQSIRPSRLFQQVLNRVPDPILLVDDSGEPIFINPAFRRLCVGFSKPREVPTKNQLLRAIFNSTCKSPKQRGELSKLFFSEDRTGEAVLKIDGVTQQVRWYTIDLSSTQTGRVYLVGNEVGEYESIQAMGVSELEPKKNPIHSRKQLLEELEFVIQNYDHMDLSSAVYIVDIDDFKLVNDSIGYRLGDKLLGMVGERISKVMDVPHSVGKLSGDEFCVLATGIKNLNQIPAMGREINRAFASAINVNGQETHISVSIGISVIRPDNHSAESVIQQADLAMYQAKQMGGNCYCFYNEDVKQEIQDRFYVRNEIRKALARNEFEMHYQPKLDLRTGKLGGAEALIRWVRNGKFFRSPAEFIAEAETCGLILSISKWVFERVAQDMARWKKLGFGDISTSLNVSPCHFRLGDPEMELSAAFQKYYVDPKLVEIEVTENVFLENLDQVIEQLNQIRANGFSISIDDFGVGCNSLAYLKRLPVTALKLDRSFISGVVECDFDATLVESMINIAHSLDQTVVAEGVESQKVANKLKEMGCDYIQGYWYAKPLSIDDFEDQYLKERQ